MVATPSKEMFHVAGDMPDPSGTTALRGVSPGYKLTEAAEGHPIVFYRDLILTADVYRLEGEPMQVHIMCPLCALRNVGTGRQWGLRITADRKAIEYDPRGLVRAPAHFTAADVAHFFPQGLGGRLDIEPFSCTWEESPELQRSGGGISAGRCSWKVAIEGNIARDV